MGSISTNVRTMNKKAHLKTILSLLGFATLMYLAVKYPAIFCAVAIPIGSVTLYLSLYNLFKSQQEE